MLQIEDVNDNMPIIPGSDLVMCSRGDTLSSVVVKAEDKDQSPYSTPFIFELGAEHDGKWKLKDATSKILLMLEECLHFSLMYFDSFYCSLSFSQKGEFCGVNAEYIFKISTIKVHF